MLYNNIKHCIFIGDNNVRNYWGDRVDILRQGIALYKKAEYYKAIRCFDEICSKGKFISNDDLYQAEAYRGDSYFRMANYIEAMKSYKECVSIAEKMNNKKSIFQMMYKITSIYCIICDFDSAIESAEKVRLIADELNDPYMLGKSYNALGTVCMDSTENDKAKLNEGVHAFKRGLKCLKNTNYIIEKATLNSNLGEAYCKLGMPEMAIKYLKCALELERDIDDKSIRGYTLSTLALSYYNLNDFNTALKYANKAVSDFKDIRESMRIAYTYQLFSKIYRKNGDYEKALEYYMFYAELMIEIKNKEYIKTISNMRKEYDLLKIEKDNEIYKIKNEELATVNAKLIEAYKEVNRLSQKDYLTGIYNRRGIKAEISKLKNKKENGIILIDIDYFKSVNDSFGHDVGDNILKEVASRIAGIKEENYIFGRWGGEEFLIILPGKNIDETFMFAEKVSNVIRGESFKARNLDVKITITAGIDTFVDISDFARAVKSVDKKLYIGKNLGRNKNIK